MTYKIHSKIYNLLLISSLLMVHEQISALTSDNQQPIYINSAQQMVDMKTNIVTFTGQVIIKKGSIDIRADKMVITRSDNKSKHEVIEGYGTPITFYQLQDDGKSVCGHALKIRYETTNDLIILTGDAYIEYLDSKVKGDRITYLIKKQQMKAFSDKGKQVSMMLVPVQPQNKNNIKS